VSYRGPSAFLILGRCLLASLNDSFLFPLMEKETKRSRTNEWLRPFVRPTHMKSMGFCSWFLILRWEGKVPASCYMKTMEALCPDLILLYKCSLLDWHRDKALIISLLFEKMVCFQVNYQWLIKKAPRSNRGAFNY